MSWSAETSRARRTCCGPCIRALRPRAGRRRQALTPRIRRPRGARRSARCLPRLEAAVARGLRAAADRGWGHAGGRGGRPTRGVESCGDDGFCLWDSAATATLTECIFRNNNQCGINSLGSVTLQGGVVAGNRGGVIASGGKITVRTEQPPVCKDNERDWATATRLEGVLPGVIEGVAAEKITRL